MQVHQSMAGYQRRPLAYAVYVILVLSTAGLVWVLACFFPQTVMWTLRPCSLSKAHFVLNKLVNKHQILSPVQEVKLSSHKAQYHGGVARADSIRVFVLLLTTYQYCATAGTFVVLEAMPKEIPQQVTCARQALMAINQAVRFAMSPMWLASRQKQARVVARQHFGSDPALCGALLRRPVPLLSAHLSQVTAQESGAEWSVFNPTRSWSRRNRAQLYGLNTMAAGKPNVFDMAFRFLLHPIYIIQYVELAFTMYRQYYCYAGILLSITFLASYFSTKELYSKRLQLYGAVAQRRFIPLVSGGRVRGVSSHRLVPGDVVVLLRGKATCDMVLLQGGCLVEESVLSGEAAQVRKTSFVPSQGPSTSSSTAYDPDVHQPCTVFAGTYVQQVWNEDNADEEVLAMVVRTGLRSAMGDMLRQVMAPVNHVNSARDPFVADLLRYCAVALVLQVAISMLNIATLDRYDRTAQATVAQVAAVLIAAVPSSIPTVISFSLFRCMISLKKRLIEVHHVRQLKTVAAVDCCVFDKTGTLTGCVPEFHSMVPVKAGKLETLQQGALCWPSSLKQCIAVCNSLNLVNRHDLVGDLADYTAFKACEARFVGRNLVALPLQPSESSSARMANLVILRRFEFRSQLLRSGVIVRDSARPPDDAQLFIRGASAAVEQLVGPDKVPADYQQVVDDFASKGLRLLALCGGSLRGLSKEGLARLSQEQLEARVDRFTLLGLLVLSNSLRPDTKETITKLQQEAGLRTLMVTGDYHHTALAVAREAGMTPPQGQVIIIHKAFETPSLPAAPSRPLDSATWMRSPQQPASPFALEPRVFAGRQVSVHQGLVFQMQDSIAAQDDALQALTLIAQGEAQCCVTGPAFEQLLQLGDLPLLETVMRNVVVFSRMKPHQKGQVMDLLSTRGLHQLIDGQQHQFPGLGKTCMYCGDGINDLIALATADVGVAIGAGDVSAAATISTKHCSIADCVTVLREARAAQNIKLAAIRYMVICQLIFSLAFNICYYIDGSEMNHRQRGVLDVVAVSLGCVCSLRAATERLSRDKPRQWLFGIQYAVLLAAVALMMGCMYATVFWFLFMQPWYTGSTAGGDKDDRIVTTLAWIVALCQAGGAPILTFHTGTAAFCKPTSLPEAFLIMAYGIVISAVCLAGPAAFDKHSFFGLYPYDWHFRWRSGSIFIGTACICLALLAALQSAINMCERRKQQCRIVPIGAAIANQ